MNVKLDKFEIKKENIKIRYDCSVDANKLKKCITRSIFYFAIDNHSIMDLVNMRISNTKKGMYLLFNMDLHKNNEFITDKEYFKQIKEIGRVLSRLTFYLNNIIHMDNLFFEEPEYLRTGLSEQFLEVDNACLIEL